LVVILVLVSLDILVMDITATLPTIVSPQLPNMVSVMRMPIVHHLTLVSNVTANLVILVMVEPVLMWMSALLTMATAQPTLTALTPTVDSNVFVMLALLEMEIVVSM
jgi:hypothetical protein